MSLFKSSDKPPIEGRVWYDPRHEVWEWSIIRNRTDGAWGVAPYQYNIQTVGYQATEGAAEAQCRTNMDRIRAYVKLENERAKAYRNRRTIT